MLDFLYNPVSEYYTYPSIILEFYFVANNTWYLVLYLLRHTQVYHELRHQPTTRHTTSMDFGANTRPTRRHQPRFRRYP